METRKKAKRTARGRASRDGGRNRPKNDVLAILVDERSGREYYVSVLDSFTIEGQTYSVMYNYEPDDGSRSDPEIVIMRSWKDKNGEQVFSSITGRKELDLVFEYFFERYTDSLIRS